MSVSNESLSNTETGSSICQGTSKSDSSTLSKKTSEVHPVIASLNLEPKISVSTASSPALSTPQPSTTPVLRKVGEKTPPGTLTRNKSSSSCKSWYSQYSQAFLSKTIGEQI